MMMRVRMISLALFCVCSCFVFNIIGYLCYRIYPLVPLRSQVSLGGSGVTRLLEVKATPLLGVNENVRDNISSLSTPPVIVAGLGQQSRSFASLDHVDLGALRRHALGMINSNRTLSTFKHPRTTVKHSRTTTSTPDLPGTTFSSSILSTTQPIDAASRELSHVFRNFSISFQDLKTGGRKFFPNPVNFKKFVVTLRQRTEMSTAKTSIPLDNLSIVDRVTPAPKTSGYLNPHPYSYTLLEENVCPRNTSVKMLVVIVVCSSIDNFIARKAIRDTWGSRETISRWKVGLVFMIGATTNQTIQSRLQDESSFYHDIIQEDFLDTYRNLSLKSVAILKWVSTYCDQVKYMLKTDDDMFINVQNLQIFLEKSSPKRAIIGSVIAGARPIQYNRSKWYTPVEEFSDRFYPAYCSGTAYAISSDIIGELYNVTLHTKLFWLEDIYITGICARKIKKRHVNNRGFTYLTRQVSGCAFRTAISGHKVSSGDMYKIWKELMTPNVICPTTPPLKRPQPLVVRRRLNIPQDYRRRIIRTPRPPRQTSPTPRPRRPAKRTPKYLRQNIKKT